MARGHKPSPKPSSSFNAGPNPAASKAPRVVPGERNYEDYRMKILAEFIKLKPPKFEGLPDPLAAETWLNTVKGMLDATRVLRQFRVGFAIYLFDGLAEDWLDTKGDKCCAVANLNWGEFEKLFRETYIPDARLKREMLAELCKLGQRKMTVALYFSRFVELSRYNPAMEADPALRCDEFRRGLRPNIRAKLAAYAFTDIDVLVDAAFHAEAAFERINRGRKLDKEKNKALAKKSCKAKSERYKQCACTCNRVGHKMRHCPGKQSKRPQAMGGKSSIKSSSSGYIKRFNPNYSCNTCGQIGHKKSKRPFKKLQSQCDIRGSQSGRADRIQPEIFAYQNTPPPRPRPPPPPPPSLAAKEQPSQNVPFNSQSHADLMSHHRSGGDGFSKTIVGPPLS